MKQKITLPKTGKQLADLLIDTYQIQSGAALALVGIAKEALDTANKAEALVKKHGILIDGERGLRGNPACSVARDARNRLLNALGKLNLEL